MNGLETNDILPLYIQLSDRIGAQIEAGELKSGDRIPSETQLCRDYAVSRVTVRRSIEKLVEEGYLVKRQGKGTYVAFPEMVERLRDAESGSFTDIFLSVDMVPSTKVILKELVCWNEKAGKQLKIPAGEQIVHIVRVRYINGCPAVFEEDFLPLAYNFLLNIELDNASIFNLIHGKMGIAPTRYYDTFQVKAASEEQARLLDVCAGDVLLFVKQLVMDADDGIIYYNEQLVRSDVYKYTVKSS